MAAQDLADWLAQAEQLFRSMLRGRRSRLRIIVTVDGDTAARGIELCTGGGLDPAGQVVSLREEPQLAGPLTATDLSPQEPASVRVEPVRGLPVIEPVELDGAEADVLLEIEAERGRLQGPELSRKLRRKYDAALRRLLSRMRHKRRLLDWSAGEGYGLSLRGSISLAAWKANSLLPDDDAGE